MPDGSALVQMVGTRKGRKQWGWSLVLVRVGVAQDHALATAHQMPYFTCAFHLPWDKQEL